VDLALRNPRGSVRLGWDCMVLKVGNCSAVLLFRKVFNASFQITRLGFIFPLFIKTTCLLLLISVAYYPVHATNTQVSVIVSFLSPLLLIFLVCFFPFLKHQVLEFYFLTHIFRHTPLPCILCPYTLRTGKKHVDLRLHCFCVFHSLNYPF